MGCSSKMKPYGCPRCNWVMLFGRDKSVVSRHIRNVFKRGKWSAETVVAKNATTAADDRKTHLPFNFVLGKTLDKVSIDTILL